jgi:hypothetical protein
MPDSFNILYIVSVVLQRLSGMTLSSAQAEALTIVEYVEWVALGLSVCALAFYIWTRVKESGVEHEIHHKRLHAEMETAGAHHARNPRWERVVELANAGSESDWRRAILEADIMLGDLLEQRGYAGADIGEKLRSANQTQFATLDFAWEAHRLRNQVAHLGEGLELSQRDALAAVDMYRRVFEEFGYI